MNKICEPNDEIIDDFIKEASYSFLNSLKNEDYTAAYSILNTFPQIKKIKLSTAGHSPIHWCCASIKTAPLLNILLDNNLSYDKYIGVGSPVDWAFQNRNYIAIEIFILKKLLTPNRKMLLDSCLRADFKTAQILMIHSNNIDPWEIIDFSSPAQIIQNFLKQKIFNDEKNQLALDLYSLFEKKTLQDNVDKTEQKSKSKSI